MTTQTKAPTEWFTARDGQQLGPFTNRQLLQRAQVGELLPTDMVWKEGLSAWQPAEKVKGLFASSPQPAEAPGLAPPPLPAVAPATIIYHTPQSRDAGPDAGVRLLLPVGRSGWAIAAGYLGLIGLFPFVGLPFAIGAVISGILAIRDIKRHPDRHGMGRAIFALIAGGLMIPINALGIVVLALDL